MDDSSLDDFFAKKDKSKKKSKGKSSKTKIVAAELLPSTPPNEGNASGTDDLMAQQVQDVKIDEELGDQKERKKTRRKKDRDTDDQRKKEDDEWVAPEEEVDYSGLRIAAKNLAKSSADDGNEEGADSDVEYDEHGQVVPRSSEQGSVWRSMTPVMSGNPDQEGDDDAEIDQTSQAPVAEATVPELPNVTGGKYVPPSRRGQSSASSPATGRNADGSLQPMSLKRPMRKKTAPNITSQEDFPTLGAAPPPSDPDTTNFERVRGGVSGQPVVSRSGGASRVETRNMFNALR